MNKYLELAEALEEQAELASLGMNGAKPQELLEWHAAAEFRKLAQAERARLARYQDGGSDFFACGPDHDNHPFFEYRTALLLPDA